MNRELELLGAIHIIEQYICDRIAQGDTNTDDLITLVDARTKWTTQLNELQETTNATQQIKR